MLQHCTSSNAQENGELEKTSMGPRQLSVSSDSRLLEDEIKQEVKVILRPKKPPRPQSEVFLDQVDKRRTKRYSAFGVSPRFLILREKAFRRLSETTSMEGEKSFWFLISFSRITSYRSYSRLFENLSAVSKSVFLRTCLKNVVIPKFAKTVQQRIDGGVFENFGMGFKYVFFKKKQTL